MPALAHYGKHVNKVILPDNSANLSTLYSLLHLMPRRAFGRISVIGLKSAVQFILVPFRNIHGIGQGRYGGPDVLDQLKTLFQGHFSHFYGLFLLFLCILCAHDPTDFGSEAILGGIFRETHATSLFNLRHDHLFARTRRLDNS